jgi:type III secretion protein W
MSQSIQGGPGGADSTLNVELQTGKEAADARLARQVDTQTDMQADMESRANPLAARQEKAAKTLPKESIKALLKKEKPQQLGPIEKIAKEFAEGRKNPELKEKTLVILRKQIREGDTKEEILKKLLDVYPDVSLAAEALDFLLLTTSGPLATVVQEAKTEFLGRYSREIVAGQNIGDVARAAAGPGVGSPTDLRNMYRGLIDPNVPYKDAPTLFQELSQKYAFKDMKKVIDFFFHSLGADLNSKGPSIEPGRLQDLVLEARTLQAVLGVYRFFKGRMSLVDKRFAKESIPIPPQLSFESFSKQFMALVTERYPTAEKALQAAAKLGAQEGIPPKIIVIEQFRDAIREVAVTLIYRSLQHRDDLQLSLLEALDDLEDELEALTEKTAEEEIEPENPPANSDVGVT